MHGLHFFVVPLHGILKSTTSIYDYLSSVIGRTYIKVCPYKILFTQKLKIFPVLLGGFPIYS